jgi:hypothetical protein
MLKRPYAPANPRASFPLLVTFCSAPVVYFCSALDTQVLYSLRYAPVAQDDNSIAMQLFCALNLAC